MDLKEYIKRVYELEKSCYTQEHFIRLLEQKLGQVQRTNFVSPVNIASIKKPEKEGVVSTCICGMIVGAILSVIVIVVMLLTGTLGYFAIFFIEAGDPPERFLLLILNGCVALVIIGMIFGGVLSVSGEKESFANQMDEYNQKVQQSTEYNREAENTNRHIATQIKQKCDILTRNLAEAKGNYKETTQVLNNYYDIGIIFPKYRNFVPITMFYEYLSSGICSQLEGHEGAYNTYEQELRMNLILSKLDDIIVRLDQIQENQYMLANAIQEGNRTAQKIYSAVSNCADQLQDISANTEATMYFSQVTAMNTTYMAWFKKWR